ncbi:MAG: c-type cytochrome, partial [Planctomycetaceae bacterium]|nr:c-type cytochrome [Planctomycetaceae bacterium]
MKTQNQSVVLSRLVILLNAVLVTGLPSEICADEKSGALVARSEQSDLLERGALIYKDKCAVCHGAAGEGVKDEYGKFHDKLAGDMTIGELTKLVHDTMPDGEADQCVGEDARAVSEYIHYSFYSEAAQIRNRPPRIALARLTANQLRQSLADLYAHFGGVPAVSDKSGVKAIYFNGPRWKNENKKIERTDPTIDFDFGHESPGEGIEAKSFYIYWEGG